MVRTRYPPPEKLANRLTETHKRLMYKEIIAKKHVVDYNQSSTYNR